MCKMFFLVVALLKKISRTNHFNLSVYYSKQRKKNLLEIIFEGCFLEWYCGAACQKTDWTDHKVQSFYFQ